MKSLAPSSQPSRTVNHRIVAEVRGALGLHPAQSPPLLGPGRTRTAPCIWISNISELSTSAHLEEEEFASVVAASPRKLAPLVDQLLPVVLFKCLGVAQLNSPMTTLSEPSGDHCRLTRLQTCLLVRGGRCTLATVSTRPEMTVDQTMTPFSAIKMLWLRRLSLSFRMPNTALRPLI